MKNLHQLALLTLLATSVACASSSKAADDGRARAIAANTPVENTGMHERNLMLVERAKANPSAKLMFLGDSITQGWDAAGRAVWDAQLAPMDAINLGVSGDRTEHVLWRLEQGGYDELRPELIVMMIGTNNTGHRMDPPEDIADGVRAILADLQRRFPKAKLALLAIFPRGETGEDLLRLNNEAANVRLNVLARERGVEWLDLSRVFVYPDGALSKELMPDLLHPSGRGYEAWAAGMREPLQRWMR
jgi:lysophospholipase L1-like esterase